MHWWGRHQPIMERELNEIVPRRWEVLGQIGFEIVPYKLGWREYYSERRNLR